MIDTRAVVSRLRTLESLAIIPRVASTNLVARRVVNECLDSELSLPQAIIVAREQFAGQGRNHRSWSSPRDKGIYATTLLSRPLADLSLLPLEVANAIASYLEEVFGIDTRIKWPNDILAGGRKIAGILIEARIQEDRAYLLIGTGINVEPVTADDRPNSVSIREVTSRDSLDIDTATTAFVEHFDARLSEPTVPGKILEEWRRRTIHKPGDRISCMLGERTVTGSWQGIDEFGRALLQENGETLAISAGDLILA